MGEHRKGSMLACLAMTALILGTNCRVGGSTDLSRGISDGGAKGTTENKRQVVRA
jgi:hypothetical protein